MDQDKLINTISELTIAELKPEYVVLAKLSDDGAEVTLGGALLEEYLKDPYPVDDVRVVLDVESFFNDLSEVLSEVWAEVLL